MKFLAQMYQSLISWTKQQQPTISSNRLQHVIWSGCERLDGAEFLRAVLYQCAQQLAGLVTYRLWAISSNDATFNILIMGKQSHNKAAAISSDKLE